MSLDLGQYKNDYNHIFPKQKKSNEKEKDIENAYSPIKIYQAEKGDERVLLKVIDKELLKEEEDYDFHIECIQKEIQLNNLCNSDYILKLNRSFETDKNIVLNSNIMILIRNYIYLIMVN